MTKKIQTVSLSTTDKAFNQKFNKRLRINESINTKVEKEVNKIINDIKKHGNKSLLKYINKFDK